MADHSQILSASCNKCGASLELPSGLRFATCQFCGSRLEVRFTGGGVYTEVLDASDDGDRQIAHDLQLIKLQNRAQSTRSGMESQARAISHPSRKGGGVSSDGWTRGYERPRRADCRGVWDRLDRLPVGPRRSVIDGVVRRGIRRRGSSRDDLYPHAAWTIHDSDGSV